MIKMAIKQQKVDWEQLRQCITNHGWVDENDLNTIHSYVKERNCFGKWEDYELTVLVQLITENTTIYNLCDVLETLAYCIHTEIYAR